MIGLVIAEADTLGLFIVFFRSSSKKVKGVKQQFGESLLKELDKKI